MLLSLNLVEYSLLNYMCEIYSKTCLEKNKYILLIVFFTYW